MAAFKHSFPTAATPSGISVLINPSLARPPAQNSGVSIPQSLTKSGIASVEPKIGLPSRPAQLEKSENGIAPVLQTSSVSNSSKTTVCNSLQLSSHPSTNCNSIQHARGKTTLASQPSAITVPSFEKNNEKCKSCSEIYNSLGLNESPPPQPIQARKQMGFMFPLPRGPVQVKSTTNIQNSTFTPVSKSVTWPLTKSAVSKSAPADMEGLVENISTPKKIQHVKLKSPHPNFPPSTVPISAAQATCQLSSSVSSTFSSVSTSSVLTPTPPGTSSGLMTTGMPNILKPTQKTGPQTLPQLQQLVHANKAVVPMSCNSFPPVMNQNKNVLASFQSAPSSITPSLKLTTAAVAKPPSFGGTSPAKLVGYPHTFGLDLLTYLRL